MNRRDFLKSSAVAGAGLALPSLMPGKALAADTATVVKAKGASPSATVKKAVAELGGMEKFISKGDTVVVKPNIGWDRTVEQAANTHPEVVCEVIRMCLAAGAAKVKVFDRTCNDPRRCYQTSGIGPAVEALGDARVELSQIDERRYRTVDVPGSLFLPKWPMYEDALDANKFINLPVAKHHSASVLTLAMKNLMGVSGGNRAMMHRDLPKSLVDLNKILHSHLVIVDATRILTANGPQGGNLADVKVLDTIVAGTDVVAVDTVAAALFGKTPADVPYLKLGQEHGLGICDLDRIKVREVTA